MKRRYGFMSISCFLWSCLLGTGVGMGIIFFLEIRYNYSYSCCPAFADVI